MTFRQCAAPCEWQDCPSSSTMRMRHVLCNQYAFYCSQHYIKVWLKADKKELVCCYCDEILEHEEMVMVLNYV